MKQKNNLQNGFQPIGGVFFAFTMDESLAQIDRANNKIKQYRTANQIGYESCAYQNHVSSFYCKVIETILNTF